MLQVHITYEPGTARYRADFLHAQTIVSSKALTPVEIEGLLDVIEFDDDLTLDAIELNELLAGAYFDNDGQETNFELMLADLLALRP